VGTIATSEQQARSDHYPSRGTSKAQLLKRLDPIVYSSVTTPSPISQTLVEGYKENGFIILEDVFGKKEIESLQRELGLLRNNEKIRTRAEVITEPGDDSIRSIFRIHQLSSIFRKLGTNRRLVQLAQYLLGDRVYIYQSRLNYKPGFYGKEFYWHSDFETWHVEDGMPIMRALSMSITLTDNYETNGPLMLIPGSHKHYVVCEGETPKNHFKDSLKKQEYGVPSIDYLSRLVDKSGIVTATGKPGSVIIFDCNTMHGSNSNITPYPRSNVFFVYNALSNHVVEPFCNQPPRPEYICAREAIEPVQV